MKIYYRISPFKPDNPAVIFPDDKEKLVKFCHNSFLEAGGTVFDTTYILDSCPQWNEYFKPFGKVVNITSHSKVNSLTTAYDFGLHGGDDSFFIEDDYLWRTGTIPVFEKALKQLKVLSPYDHPAHYLEDRFDKHYLTCLIDNNVYRACPSNTHTFGITKDVFKEHFDLIKGYGVDDHQTFTKLNEYAQLWCPTYSFATHLASGNIAPNVDWHFS